MIAVKRKATGGTVKGMQGCAMLRPPLANANVGAIILMGQWGRLRTILGGGRFREFQDTIKKGHE